MIQPRPGDLVAIEANGRYYYAAILDRIRLFGGNWVFVFASSSERVLAPEEVLASSDAGWHAFVDFIWAKREGRVTRIARGLDLTAFRGPTRVKSSNAFPHRATRWFIQDLMTGETQQKSSLDPSEQALPMNERIDDTTMVRRVDDRWSPSWEYQRQSEL